MAKLTQYRDWTFLTHLRAASGALALLFAFGQVVATTSRAEGQEALTFTLVHGFIGGSDGGEPQDGLIRDAAGNLYGTTTIGGSICNCGTVFKVDPTGNKTVLYSFVGGTDGALPVGGVIRDAAGNLYGTTYAGGASCGCGTVFKLDKTANETIMYRFLGGDDGAAPFAALVRDESGNLYGTTERGGGACGCGTVFRLNRTGTEIVMHRFLGGTDGSNPYASLVQDAAGNFYGTTYNGGGTSNYGTVFKVDTQGGETVLYRFLGGTDGRSPMGGLVLDQEGTLYGTTQYGGAFNYGTVFKLDLNGKERVLDTFTGKPDGENPIGSLIRDAKGNLYGTTCSGGGGLLGNGTAIKLDTSGTETILHRFNGTTDGSCPAGALTRDAQGNLYGITVSGITFRLGTIFKLSPRARE